MFTFFSSITFEHCQDGTVDRSRGACDRSWLGHRRCRGTEADRRGDAGGGRRLQRGESAGGWGQR